MIDTTPYRTRRAAVLERIGSGLAIVPTAPERMRNRDSDYLYRFDSYFYYLTGFPEPDAVLVLVAGAAPKAILFCREKHPERELWEGFRYGPEAARGAFGFDETYPIAELDAKLPQLIANQPALHYAPGMDAAWDARVMRWLNDVRALARTGVAPRPIRDLRVTLDAMRLVKDDHELADAARGHDLAGAHVRDAPRGRRMEYEIEAELLYEPRHGHFPIGRSSPVRTRS
jgi:Xaa-Pro aminopeptidase